MAIDRGSEFLNDLFEEWITRELGAKQLFSNIEHPWENGRAERSFATLFQKARAMLKYADLPNAIWGKAIVHAAYLKNRSPSTRLNLLAPLQFRTGEAQDFTRLRVFGCPAQIFVRPNKRKSNKLSSRSEKGTLIGISALGNGYIFRIQRTNRVVEVDSRDVKFNETFSDCMDRQGRKIKGGKVLDPDLFNEPEMAYDIMKAMEKWKIKETSRFANTNRYAKLRNDSNSKEKELERDNDPESKDDDNDSNSEQKEQERKNDPESYDNDNNSNSEQKEHEHDSEQSDNDSEQSDNEREKPFDAKNLRKRETGPMKTKETNSRETKRLLPSKGFRTELKMTSANQSETEALFGLATEALNHPNDLNQTLNRPTRETKQHFFLKKKTTT